VLLNTCLQVLEAISPDESQQNIYVPVGLERLILCGRPSVSMWGYARVRVEEESESQKQQILSADLELFAASGRLIAVLEGVQLKAVRRDKPPASWLRSESFRLEGSQLGTLDIGQVEIQELHGDSRAGAQHNSKDFLHNALLSATPAERPLLLESRITEQVARVLGFSPAKLNKQNSLMNLGLDSLTAIELRNRFNNEMGVNLPVIKIIEGASISQLAELMLSQLALAGIITSASLSTELDEDMEEIIL
jgi:aryl carrier-like protein